jgi:hypothetical protein
VSNRREQVLVGEKLSKVRDRYMGIYLSYVNVTFRNIV